MPKDMSEKSSHTVSPRAGSCLAADCVSVHYDVYICIRSCGHVIITYCAAAVPVKFAWTLLREGYCPPAPLRSPEKLCVCKCVIERKGVTTPGIIVVMLLARKRRTWRCDVLRWKLWVKTRKEVTLHQACINLFPWRWEWETRALPFYPRSNRGLVLVTKPSRKQNLFFLINSSSSWFWKKEKVVRTLLI